MRSQDRLRLDTIRYLLSLIKNAEIDLKREVSDEEFLQIVQKEVKRRRDAIEQFKTVGRQETAQEEEDKLEVLTHFLPEQIIGETLIKEINKIKQELGSPDLPQLMKEVQARLKGKADGREISQIVQQVLSS